MSDPRIRFGSPDDPVLLHVVDDADGTIYFEVRGTKLVIEGAHPLELTPEFGEPALTMHRCSADVQAAITALAPGETTHIQRANGDRITITKVG